MATYSGLISSLPQNGVFVFGANTQGIHGGGAAKIAYQKFGAKYGYVGLMGSGPYSYGIITKDLRVKEQPSIPKGVIISQIITLYHVAKQNPHLYFYVAYTANSQNLNYYSWEEMAEMFYEACHYLNLIPQNIVFEDKFFDEMKRIDYFKN